MMRRKDQMLTRAMLLEEVWNYKFVPQKPIWSTSTWAGSGARSTSRTSRP